MRDGRRMLVAVLAIGALGAAGCGEDAPDPTDEPAAAPRAGEPAPQGAAPPPGDGAGGVRLEPVGEFDQPVYVTAAPGDGALYVVEQCGRIQRVTPDGQARPFLEIPAEVTCGGEQGLFSVAFGPRGSDRLWVYFTGLDEDQHVVEYRRSTDDPALADPASARELLRMDDFAANHNGGQLQLGPDGLLWAGTGDGGGAGDPERTAQDPASPLGKLLRLDPTARRPEPEVVALGLRNPWRFSFDRVTDDLWIGDVGQDEVEEIDAVGAADVRPTLNFGWSALEGTQRFNSDQRAPDALAPVHEYGREGGCSVTGGYVVRDRSLPSLYGRYLYGDFCQGELRSFTARPGAEATDDRPLGLQVPALSSFGEDRAGHLYTVSLEGPVSRLVAEGG